MFSQQGDINLYKKESFCCATDLLCIEQEWLTDLKKVDTPKVHAVQDFLTKVSSTNVNTLSKTFSCEKFLAISNVYQNFAMKLC